jgi:hypothetical protein
MHSENLPNLIISLSSAFHPITHVLQPYDVGVFGPLASCWKSEVNISSGQYVSITKGNLIEHYSQARDWAFKETTICKAFSKTGLWPPN